MKREYITPSILTIEAAVANLMSVSGDPKVSGTVKGSDGGHVAGFGYGGDGTDGDEADARGSIW